MCEHKGAGYEALYDAMARRTSKRVMEAQGQRTRKVRKQRLAQGARPHLVFLMIQGVLKEAKVDLDSKEQVVLDELEGAFAHIEPGRIIEVVSRQSEA